MSSSQAQGIRTFASHESDVAAVLARQENEADTRGVDGVHVLMQQDKTQAHAAVETLHKMLSNIEANPKVYSILCRDKVCRKDWFFDL